MPSFGKRTPFGNSDIGFEDGNFGKDPHLGPFEIVYGSKSDGTAIRTQGEWSFNVESVETTDTDENEGVDVKLAKSRWRSFSREWISEHKGDSLDISWLKDKDSIDAANLLEPSVLAIKAKSELELAVIELESLLEKLGVAD